MRKSKRRKIRKIITTVRWGIATILGLAGLVILTAYASMGIIMLCIAFVISPLIKTVIKKIAPNWVFKERIRIILLIILSCLFVVSAIITGTREGRIDVETLVNQTEDESSEPVLQVDNEIENNVTVDGDSVYSSSGEVTNLLSDDEYQRFIEACNEAQFDIYAIKGMKQIDDWASGKRYSFVYKGNSFILYMLENGYVDGINLGLIQIYKDGYKARNVNEYIIDVIELSELEVLAEQSVKTFLNHPSTADFHWVMRTSAYCFGDVYNISSEVTAENSFGVADDVPFTVQFDRNSKNVIYVNINGEVKLGNEIEDKELEKTESKIKAISSGIMLVDGEEGEYGVLDKKYDIIFYYLPSGTYDVVAHNKGMVFVTNPNNTDDSTVYKFDASGDKAEITIPEGYYVELMINTIVEFNKK